MKNKELFEIVNENRQCGSTTWLVKAAIKNPNCIIIAYDKKCAKEIELAYFYWLKKSNLFNKLKWKFFGREHPKFLCKNDNLRGYGLPIIFDNSSLCK